jgi:hypothetical protein
MKDIYSLELFEATVLSKEHAAEYLKVRRVPGGWTFTECSNDIDHDGNQTTQMSSVFVPMDKGPKKGNRDISVTYQ